MYSDNGTNFVSAASTMKEFYLAYLSQNHQKKITEFVNSECIQWHFNPPGSPHFGGLYESNIKSMKTHLYKILQDTKLNYESFNTLLVQVEGVLNTRPLSPMSTSPDDFNPITPFHLLTGRSGTSIYEASLENIPANRLDQFQHRQLIITHFWRRWSREVLPELQRRTKWMSQGPKVIKKGELVLLSDTNTPPFQWPMGRIQELFPGADGVVRVVLVKLPNGNTVKRAVHKLCVLPVD